MAEIFQIDPLMWGYFQDESLEHGEKVGLALVTAAKHCELGFSAALLPEPCLNSRYGTSGYSPYEGLWFRLEAVENVIREYPEHEESFRYYAERIRVLQQKAERIRAQSTRKLAAAAAHWGGDWGGHANPDYGRIVNLGTDGIREMIAAGSEKNPGGEWFYRSCNYAMDALDILGDRYSALAKEKAESCPDAADREWLLRMAEAFRTVPRKPAYDFASALCAFMLVFVIDGSDSPGRFDQYMYRAYCATKDKAEVAGLLEKLWDYFHDHRSWNLCVSGSDENWKDETNSLTYEILAMARKTRYQTPNLTLRVHRNTPERLWKEITATLAVGTGLPALYNDEIVCTALEKLGIPPCDSHDYCMNGCNQIDILGKSHMGLEDGEVMLAKCLELALHNGTDAMTGEQISIQTGDCASFTSYEQLERAFLDQMEYVTYQACSDANNFQHCRGVFEPHPLRSCLIEGCIEKGRDYRDGGPLYNHGQILAEGIADVGDSLYAVKKLVYDEKKYTMQELLSALRVDFEGFRRLHHDFSGCAKFGNDIPEVDAITGRILNRFLAILKRHNTYRGGMFTGGCCTFTRAPGYGRATAALPNGKKKGEPLLADGIGATPGRDVNGPTALINSVLSYQHDNCCSGFIFQTKFNKSLFADEKGRETFTALAKTYFARGGQQLTVTVVSPEDLQDAKLHPENHRDLIVRVGGYSDYFVNLAADLQDSILERTFLEF